MIARKLYTKTLRFVLVAICFLVLLCSLAPEACAGPANPEPQTVVQPDGTSLDLHLQGDEFQNWTELDDTGYTVIHNPDTRYWEYAEQAGDGSLVRSGVRAEPHALNAPKHLPKRLKPPRNLEHEERMREMILDTYQQRLSQAQSSPSSTPSGSEALAAGQWNPVPVSGERKLLVILINYANRTFTSTPQSWYDKIFDDTVKSVAKYYKENSFNGISITPVAHTQPGSPAGVISVTVGDNHPNYGGNSSFATDQTIGNHALLQAAPYVNFNSFDTNGDGKLDTSEVVIYFVHAGYETSAGSGLTPSVWAHAWWTTGAGLTAGTKNVQRWGLNGELFNSTTAMGLGVITHELGHQFCGLPDLYDTSGFNGALGNFSVMASGSWGYNTGEPPGYTPTLLDAWSREYLGWAAPATPVVGPINLIPPLTASNAVYKLVNPAISTAEYYLVENRQPSGWDLGLKGSLGSGWAGGLLALRIDTNIGTPAGNDINMYVAGSHQGVVPVQASTSLCNMLTTGCRGNATTLFYSGNNNNWTNATSPNTRYYSGTSTNFSLAGISTSGNPMTATFSDGIPPTVSSVTPANGATGVGTASAVTVVFSQPMTSATINSSTFTLSGGIAGTVGYDAPSQTATLSPSSLLANGTTYTATITTGVTNAAGIAMTATNTWNFTTSLSSLALTTSNSLPTGTIGTPYSQGLSAAGGTPPYAWGIVSGALPTGLSLNGSTGLISGTPVVSGVFSFGSRVADTVGASITRTFAIAVSAGACANWPVLIQGVTPAYYSDFPSAYQLAVDGNTIALQALDFSSDLILDRALSVTLRGGYDCGYTATATTTGLLGKLRVSNGTAKVDKLRFK